LPPRRITARRGAAKGVLLPFGLGRIGTRIGWNGAMPAFLTPDICIIGGGPAGLALARAARRYGASVVVVEKDPPGGDTSHAGAISARAFAAAARRAQALRTAAAFGITAGEPKINAREVFDYVHRVTTQRAAVDSAEQLRARGIELVPATARFLDARTIAAGDQQYRARRFVIATGARPIIPGVPGLADVPYFTSATILDNPRKLTHLVIIGSSPTAVELAQAYRRLGSGVTLLAATPPLANYDPELVEIALRRLADEGVDIRADTTPAAIEARSLGTGVVIRQGETEERLDASHILVAGEGRARVEELGVDKAGIQLTPTAGLVLDKRSRTTNRLVYAFGDATGAAEETHGLDSRADRLARHLLFRLPIDRRDPRLPRAVFTDPEIAEVGLSEAAARRRHARDFRVLRLSLAENDRARIENETYGLVKLMLAPTGRLLGASIVGTGAAEMISLFAYAIGNNMPLASFRNFVAPYPTLTAIARALADEAATRRRPENPLLARLLRLNRMLP
jgi:pyruvate/2-oxoglutarate dehydrogenase complex dihydrolipoamide dehydrogenase (E3) component